MAPSPPPLQAEDQTDEQFFDKLVDDEYGAAQSHLKPEDMARALSNLSLVEMDDSGSASEVNGLKDNQYLNSSASSKNDASIGEAQSEVFSKGASGGPKGASVKEIQWSALSVNSEQFELGDFESDLLSGSGYGSLANPQSFSEPKAALIENTSENIISRVGYYEQQDAQVYSSVNEQSADLTEMQNWETLYPGWKYDSITEQWFQVDGYDATSNIQSDKFSIVSANTHESSGTKVQNAFEESVSEISGVLNHQQTSYPVLETISEESNLLNSWNQVSQGSIYYPSNMVFDPQYPEWYYDTITQMWYTLESYNHALHDASNAIQDPQATNVNALTGLSIHDHHVSYGSQAQSGQYMVLEQSNQKSHWDASASGFGKQNMWQEQNGQEGHWNASDSGYDQKKMWKPELYIKNEDAISFSNDHLTGSFYGSQEYTRSHLDKQLDTINLEPRVKHNLDQSSITASRGYVTSENMYHYNQPNMEQSLPAHLSNSNYGTESSINYVQQSFQVAYPSYSQISYAPNEGRSTSGRPPHALVSFGFGGKILVLKASFSSSSFVSGSQGTVGGAVLIHSLVDVVMAETDFLNRSSAGGFSYFHTLCQQSFPGPLVGGNAASKDINKWIDDRIMSSESSSIDFENGLLLRLLLSLLKISCQHYGKLRSPYGIEPSHEGSDNPESAVSKLFASAKRNDIPFGGFDYSMHCIKNPPSEGNIRAAAIEVQNLLVSGRRKEALQRAQEGQLWGPALVLAAQLGEQFYVDSVKQMALRQFVYGSPLRTLCLLIAGQPADVFSADSSSSALSGAVNRPYQSSEVLRNSMLDDWQENLAIITSNKTNDDELVIIHLGDCLWKERGEVTAAHTCYLVAEANFEPYSDSARLCLIGADHLKNPRTYVCPDAIQRTEIYEYSKVIGNSQFVLLPFQPYKLVYAYMLAEVGKVSDSLKYCLASVKMLKNSGRSPEVQSWRTLLSSLEERLRTHQQGGYGTNLAPTKLVGKLFNSIDRSIHRMIGAPPLPPMLQNSGDGRDNNSLFQKISGSQSTLAITTLTPSSSVEAIGQWTVDSSRKVAPNRSISEPDFGRSTKQGNASMSGLPSRFGLFGSQLLQKTIGWVSLSKQDRQAKLGESNKFYYDEKLKRWVEEGADLPPANASLPSPPPTAASFQNGISEYDVKNASLTTDPVRETKLDAPSEQGAGLPPMPTSQNQFSARSRVGVRSRYVDTFNKGGGSFTSSFQPLSAPSVKPLAGANFFIPAAPTNYEDKTNDATRESIHDTIIDEPSTSTIQESTFSPSATPSSSSIQRFPSMDNIASSQSLSSGDSSVSRARAASWSGAYAHISNTKAGMERHSSVVSGVASTFAPQNDASLQVHAGGSVIDDLHEVEL